MSQGPIKSLRFEPYPGAKGYTILSASNAFGPFLPNTNFAQVPYVTSATTNGTNYSYEWRTTNYHSSGFYKLQVETMSPDDVLTAVVLNRLAYGPTPDELDRVRAMGPQAYIDEQLNMNGIPETMDAYVIETTNSIPSDPTTNWTQIVVTGRMTTTNLYLFMTQAGDVYIDDVQLVEGTNAASGPNLISNGDFESGISSWIVNGSGVSSSAVVPGVARSGGNSLHLTATASGSTAANTIWQWFPTSLTNNTTVTLSYWYLPAPTSSRLRVQLGGSGLISSAGAIPPTPEWVYAKATGAATTTPQIYLYLNGAGECYIDDIQLVAGSQAEVGPNLLANGGFESPLTGTWSASTDFTNSSISSTVAHSGSGSLRLVATAGGAGSGDSVYQIISPALVSGQLYTVSYWYRPVTPGRTLTVRLSGALLQSTPDTDSGGLYRRIEDQNAAIDDLRAWFCLHAANSPRQLFEVLSQFWENHFVTQYQKSSDYLSGFSYESGLRGRLATDWESREIMKWRNAMLNPQCTFYDLLRISAESPAMIVYLDTVNSRGDGTRVANENYARELFELFTFGVDNGYDQNDIVQCSRAWTGWSVDIVDPENVNNPLAPVSATYYPNANSTSKTNVVGTWAFVYRSANHGTNRGALFPGKTVPARFGPPWAGRNYQLTIPPRTGTSGLQDGYDVIAHLANQPFTQEYISVKLCRLFVHENFPNPTTIPGTPEYDFYDYTNPNRSAEAELVRQCMLAWENSSPKGQLRAVLSVIFNSDLFRSHAAAAQKVKTPLEFVASSIRALRSVNADGSATAFTDGYSFKSPLARMGGMGLFDRDAPDGYPEIGSSWISAGTLVERIRYLQSYCMALSEGTTKRADAGNNSCDPVALLKKKLLPSTKWNQAEEVADYFLGIFYPGEGKANLDLYRTAAINYLNTDDNGASSPLSGLGNTTTAYDTRIRSTVAMLLTLQRFQEQ